MKKNPQTELPADFDLTKYAALEDYDVSLWYRELLWRFRLYKLLNANKDKVVAHFQRHADKLGSFEQFIFDQPLKAKSTFKDIESVMFFRENPPYRIFDDGTERLQKVFSTQKNPHACITSFTVGDFMRLSASTTLQNLLVDDEEVAGLSALEFKVQNSTGVTEPKKAPLDSVFYDKSKAIINIDFSRSNDELKSAFSDFIMEYRNAVIKRVDHDYSLDAEFNTKKLSKWQKQYKVIPCIDLLLWQKFKDISYTNEQLCDMLEAKSADQVRHTIEAWVNGLLTTIALNSLRSQIG